MNPLPVPTKTLKALQWLNLRGAETDRVRCALLSNIDGLRNVIELGSFARAMGLGPDALERLCREGFIELAD
jgi:hypothetical protein